MFSFLVFVFKVYHEYHSELNFDTVVTFLNVMSCLKNEMGAACSAYVGEERRMQDFDGET